jgi:hypothetical protein
MTDTQKIENAVDRGLNIITVIGYCIPALVGILMILWGYFLDEGDLTLILVGLAIFLGFSYAAYREYKGN